MKDLDSRAEELFKEIMQHCRLARKLGPARTVRKLAAELGVSENFVSSVENGRELPSLTLFFKYLIVNNFEVEALKQLKVKAQCLDSNTARSKNELLNKIYALDEDQISFLAEQAKVAEIFKVKTKRKRKRKS